MFAGKAFSVSEGQNNTGLVRYVKAELLTLITLAKEIIHASLIRILLRIKKEESGVRGDDTAVQ